MATFLLVDGNSLTYRAFFALPTDMATASGQVTNAMFGFTSMLVNLLRDWQSGTQPALAETTEIYIGIVSQSMVAIGILMNAKRRSTVFANLWLRN